MTQRSNIATHLTPKNRNTQLWLQKNLFGSPLQVVVTLLCFWFLIWLVPAALEWLWFNADFSAQSGAQCQDAHGACWAFIGARYRLILFGTYPYDEQWRALLVSALLLLLVVLSVWSRLWNYKLVLLWLFGLTVVAILMWGGVLGLTFVPNSLWGGLPITLILTVFGIVFAFPLGVLLAMGRRSHLPVIKAISVVYIEIIRGVPLISLLFMASVMLPMFLPDGMVLDKLLRTQLAIILFAAAYVAEAVRGGLQSIPKGQFDAADAIGLTYWQRNCFVVLPQALKIVIPPLVGIFIGLLKDTSLVVIIGIYDLSLAAKTALSDPLWRGFSLETYLFVSLIYFVLCYAMSRYSKSLEQRLNTGHKDKVVR